ncbi:MAG TPA: DUF1598 domain-containing protein [Tepidisphaeraceae bacterium]
MWNKLRAAVVAGVCVIAMGQARGQTVIVPPTATAGGVYIDADGTVKYRQADTRDELAAVRERAKAAALAGKGAKEEKLAFVSLPKLFAEVQELTRAGKEIPEELRYLHGITQVRYLFVYPQEKDLVIGGPAEEWTASGKLQPMGKRTGRPVLQLDDLVVALRTAGGAQRRAFGCSIDPAPDSLEKSTEVMQKFGTRSHRELADAMTRALGPQRVSVFGTQDDTRVAFICVAADYKLKRLCLGLDASPVAGVGNAIDNSRAAASRYWFETSYEPLLASKDDSSFELRGQRLQLKAGAQSFDERGATEKGKAFAKQFTQKLPALAAAVPLFADLQNIADLSIVSALIRHDRLDEKCGWDLAWVKDPKGYPVPTVAAPKTADTLVNFTNGSLAAGGVILSPETVVAPEAREEDKKDTLAAPRHEAKEAMQQTIPPGREAK